MHALEILCTTMILVGPLITAVTLRDALLDRRALARAGINGLRSDLVRQSIRHEGLRLLKHLILAIAIVVGSEMELSLRDLALMAVSLILSINSLLDVRDRRMALSRIGSANRKT